MSNTVINRQKGRWQSGDSNRIPADAVGFTVRDEMHIFSDVGDVGADTFTASGQKKKVRRPIFSSFLIDLPFVSGLVDDAAERYAPGRPWTDRRRQVS